MKIVYLHGLAGSPRDFERVAAHLPACDYLAPEIPFLEGRFTCLTRLSREIYQDLPPRYKAGDTLVLGNSLGGAVASHLGDGFGKIILAAPHLKTMTGPMGRGRRAFKRELGKIFHNLDNLSPEQMDGYSDMWKELTTCRKRFRALRKAKDMAESFQPHNSWPLIQDKLTLVCGRHDRISPLSDFLAIKKLMPAIRLHVLDHCGHAVPLEQPERLARILMRESA